MPFYDLRRNLKAVWRDARLLVRQFRISLLAFVTLLSIGTLSLRLYYIHPDTGQPIGWAQALHTSFMLIFAEINLPFPEMIWLQIIFFVLPPVGLAVVAEGVLRFGIALFNIRERKEAWQMAIASTYQDHIIICGLGRIGYRVVKALLRLEEDVIGIEYNVNSPFLDEIQQMNVPVLLGDARQEDILEQAQIQRASAIVICTEDDLTNLAIALDARMLNPEIKVVMRMFDAQLADKVQSGFGIHTAFSTSALSAPVFAAAATRAQIDHSFYVDDMLMNVARTTIQPNSAIVGRTIGQIEEMLNISIILCQGPNTLDLHPTPDVVLHTNDHIIVFASLESLAQLHLMSGERLGKLEKERQLTHRSWFGRLWARLRTRCTPRKKSA